MRINTELSFEYVHKILSIHLEHLMLFRTERHGTCVGILKRITHDDSLDLQFIELWFDIGRPFFERESLHALISCECATGISFR